MKCKTCKKDKPVSQMANQRQCEECRAKEDNDNDCLPSALEFVGLPVIGEIVEAGITALLSSSSADDTSNAPEPPPSCDPSPEVSSGSSSSFDF